MREFEEINVKNTALSNSTITMLETLTGQVNSVNAEMKDTRTVLQTHAMTMAKMAESHKTMHFHFMIAVVAAGLLFLVLYHNTQIIQNELALQKAETNKIDSKFNQALQVFQDTVKNQPTPNAQMYLPAPVPRPAPLPPPTPSTSTSSFSFWFMVVVFIIMACALVVMYGHSSMCMKEMKNQRLLMENGAY